MKLLPIINELFGSDYIYPLKVENDNVYDSRLSKMKYRSIRYSFVTKDRVEYHVLLGIYENGEARMDFDTHGLENADHSSIIDLINTHDAIKVFNTLKSIIDKHKNEIKNLHMDSDPDRIQFYKKILDHLHIKYTEKEPNYIVAHLNPQQNEVKEDDLNDYYHAEPGARPENDKYELGEGHLIKHKWNKVDGRKLKHHKCERCKAEKWWDSGFGKLIYQDRFGKTHYRAPECAIPNTKL